MNPLQMALQIKHKLQTVAWTGGDVVFGTRGVVVFAGTPSEKQFPPAYPWALVGIGSGAMDADHPEFITQTYGIMIAANVVGDPMGEFALIGSSILNQTSSAGRGVAEVTERARYAVQSLTGADGAKIQLSSTSIGGPFPLGQTGRHIAVQELTLQALCTSQPHYAAPQQIAHDGTTWTWLGAPCSSRYDFLQYRLTRKTGSAASSSPTDGTIVYTGTAASFTGVKSSGNTYTVFADYVLRGGSDPDASSSAVVGSYLVAS